MTLFQKTEARRFITLIDALYDNRVRQMLTLSCRFVYILWHVLFFWFPVTLRVYLHPNHFTFKAPSTLTHFQTKTELFCSGYGYRPHYNAENDHRKRSHSKTLSRVERFENGDVVKIDTTVRQTTRPWLSKMVDRRYHVDSVSRQFRRPIYWNAHASSSFEHAHWGCKSVFKTDTAL